MFDSSVWDVVVYDTETTGTDRNHDQILQFAAVFADGEFRRTGQPVDIRIRRLPYVLPAPSALAVTGIDPRTIDDPSLPTEFEAAAAISRILRAERGKRRLFVTFNGIQFDDGMLRTMFYRNLVDPWFNSGQDSVKIDVLDLIDLAHALRPGAVLLGIDEKGETSRRLSHICQANGISIDAHEAVSDTVATLDLLRLICTKVPEAYRIARRAASKQPVADHMARCMAAGRPTWRFERYGKPDVVPMAVLGKAPNGSWIVADLRSPLEEIVAAVDAVAECRFVPPSPLRRVTDTKCPYMMGADEAAEVPGSMSGIDAEAAVSALLAARSAEVLAEACSRIAPYDGEPATTSEGRIFDGFLSWDEKNRMTRFREARSWHDRARVDFGDARSKDFAARILVDTADDDVRDRYGALLEMFRARCAEAHGRPWHEGTVGWTTVPACRSAADGLSPDFLDWMEETFCPADPEPEPTVAPAAFAVNAKGQLVMDL